MPPDSVYVTVSTVRWGHLLDKKFTVRRGDPIGAEVEMTLERPSGKREKTKVDFKTGAVAVDFEFNRKIRVPNSTIVNTTTELLYLDAEGTLRCRTLFEDQRKTPRQAALAVGPAVPRP
jgi:hypothetical protein